MFTFKITPKVEKWLNSAIKIEKLVTGNSEIFQHFSKRIKKLQHHQIYAHTSLRWLQWFGRGRLCWWNIYVLVGLIWEFWLWLEGELSPIHMAFGNHMVRFQKRIRQTNRKKEGVALGARHPPGREHGRKPPVKHESVWVREILFSSFIFWPRGPTNVRHPSSWAAEKSWGEKGRKLIKMIEKAWFLLQNSNLIVIDKL